MITGIHHVCVKVTDYDRAMKFYHEGLGLTPTLTSDVNGETMTWFTVGDTILEIFSGGTTPETGVIEHFALNSNDVDADYNKSLAAGATKHVEPVTLDIKPTLGEELTVRIAFVKSPTGELIEFFDTRK